MPPHLQYNRFVIHGYRPHGPDHGIAAAFASLFYWHNETGNILTHLLGAVVCAYWLVSEPPSPPLPHYWAVRLADTGSLICFCGSFAYHTFMSATPTRAEYAALLSADLCGVMLAGLTSCLAVGWLSLPCASLSFVLGVALVPSLVALVWTVAIARTAAERVLGAGLQLVTRVAIVCGGSATGATLWPQHLIAATLGIEAMAIIGGLVGAARIPERWAPGAPAFTYVFQSHTLMHCAALAALLAQHGLWSQLCALLAADEGRLACADARAAEVFGASY